MKLSLASTVTAGAERDGHPGAALSPEDRTHKSGSLLLPKSQAAEVEGHSWQMGSARPRDGRSWLQSAASLATYCNLCIPCSPLATLASSASLESCCIPCILLHPLCPTAPFASLAVHCSPCIPSSLLYPFHPLHPLYPFTPCSPWPFAHNSQPSTHASPLSPCLPPSYEGPCSHPRTPTPALWHPLPQHAGEAAPLPCPERAQAHQAGPHRQDWVV